MSQKMSSGQFKKKVPGNFLFTNLIHTHTHTYIYRVEVRLPDDPLR